MKIEFNFWTFAGGLAFLNIIVGMMATPYQVEIILGGMSMFVATVISFVVVTQSAKHKIQLFLAAIAGQTIFKFIFVGILLVITVKFTDLHANIFAASLVAAYLMYSTVEIYFAYQQVRKP